MRNRAIFARHYGDGFDAIVGHCHVEKRLDVLAGDVRSLVGWQILADRLVEWVVDEGPYLVGMQVFASYSACSSDRLTYESCGGSYVHTVT